MSANSADGLTFRSRNFYESRNNLIIIKSTLIMKIGARIKIVIATISAAAALVTLGFASHYGGLSNASNQQKQFKILKSVDDNINSSLQSRVAGYGNHLLMKLNVI